MANTYRDFRIKSGSVNINTCINAGAPLSGGVYTPLYLQFDPSAPATGANPTGTQVATADTNTVTPYNQMMPNRVNFEFPGVGFSNNVWENTNLTATIQGQVYIAGGSGLPTTTNPIFQIIMSLKVEFANPF